MADERTIADITSRELEALVDPVATTPQFLPPHVPDPVDPATLSPGSVPPLPAAPDLPDISAMPPTTPNDMSTNDPDTIINDADQAEDIAADNPDTVINDADISTDVADIPINDVDLADASEVFVDALTHDDAASDESPVPLAPPSTSSPQVAQFPLADSLVSIPIADNATDHNVELPNAFEVERGCTTSLGRDNVELKNIPVPQTRSRDVRNIPPMVHSGKKRKVQPLLPPRQKQRNIIPRLYMIGRRYPRIPLAHRDCR
ncbi:uncharacterized protein BYT42DRAFT_606594 [Radiomyces spectabilis]|uniref:uncharacterized protein n=1 Tax=Radiomyces spectabilis TaxID=64574 RepID=UPI00221ED829|nr:uncharacterized protein BYT42DRAFT_606594 [Radiomyces spectabilis]KAI8374767.1 hypothetical protein BYT42DRAFT_606594 [Radiomyces spectabilis]